MNKVDELILAMESRLKKNDLKYLKEKAEQIFMPSHCDKSDESVIEAYLDNCRFRNLSELSITEYRKVLSSLSNYSEYNLVNYDHTIIKDYLSQKKATCSARRLATLRSYISSFYEYLMQEDWITVDPMAKVPKIKVPSKHKVGISDIELAQAMKYVTNDRDIAIIEFLKSTGCRISEVCKLRVKDVDFKHRTVFIHQAKGQKDRTVSFDAKCEKALKKYLKPFPTRDGEEPFFLRRAKREDYHFLYELKPVTTDAIKNMFYQVKLESGVDNFHAHALRHYCITKLLTNKMPVKMVSMQAGHASVKTTLDVYYDVSVQEMQNEYAKAMN